MSIDRRSLDAALGFALTDEQWDVVSAPLTPAVVIAGAGTGKTTSMAVRVAYLVASGLVAPDRVLGLTFTTKAAAELLADVRRALGVLDQHVLATPDGEADEGEPSVLTYHAFASSILSAHGIRLGLEPGLPVLELGAREQLAYRTVCRSSLPLHELGLAPEGITKKLLHLDDELAELDIAPATLEAFDAALLEELAAFEPLGPDGRSLRDTARKRSVLAGLVAEWRQEKLDRDVIDYADQIRLALELVRSFPEVAAAVRAQTSVVLLDEYQDTSIAQRHLLQALFGDGHPVTAVGDPCQAIYGWRGASVDNITSFTRHFPRGEEPADRYRLTVNRRSGPQILVAANAAAEPLRGRHPEVDPLRPPERDAPGPATVACALFETALQEREWVADRIEQLGRHLSAWGGIAVLASTGDELAAMDALLRARGVPTQIYGASGLLQQPAVVELRALLEAVHDPVANDATARLLAGARWRIGHRDLAALGARARELAGLRRREQSESVEQALEQAVAGSDPADAASLSDALMDPGDPSAYSPAALERFAQLASWIRELRRHAGSSPADLVHRAAALSGLEIAISLGPDAEQQQYALGTFFDLAAEFADIGGEGTLSAFLLRLSDAERFDVDLPVRMAARADAVQLLTMYRAKGLEYDHVFIPAMSVDAFPGGQRRTQWPTDPSIVPWALREDSTPELASYPHPQDGPKHKWAKAYKEVLADRERAETERLAYVAFTRAKRTLVVTGHWWGPTQEKVRGPAPFLERIREACLDGAGEVSLWAEAPPDGATSPVTAMTPMFPWPAELPAARIAAVRSAANAVEEAMGRLGLGMDAIPEAERWDAEIAALLADRRASRAAERVVRLPERLSASAALRAIAEPEVLAVDLVRPMPRPPSPAARRGTAFHAWVETRFGQQTLLDPDDLPGAADEAIGSDAELERLQEAFARTEYAERIPVAVEEPFALVLGGRVINGRIDAVFERDGRFEVVDWKTGKSMDDRQLAVYSLAWAQLAGVPVERIDAAFVLVGTGEVVRPDIAAAIAEVRRVLG